MDGVMAATDLRDDVAAQIKEQADIVQIIGECVTLKRSGVRYLGLCPFHGEKTPSFSVHGGQQFYHCFGCGESGDVFNFMMKYYHLDFPGALKELAKRYHIEVPERRRSKEEERRAEKSEMLFAVNDKCAAIYEAYLREAPGGRIARDYLRKRGVGEDLQVKFRLGYAPATEAAGWNFLGGQLRGTELQTAIEAGLLAERAKGGCYDRFRDRILFPISDISGRICGFGGRIVGEGQPKYLNSPESQVFNKGRLLLGLHQQKECIRRQNHAVLVEGNFDLISLVAHGCNHVVAPLGTALTREQLRLLKRFAEKVTLLFDGDTAGIKAAVRAVPLFLAEQLAGRVAFLPVGHDPDTFVREKGLAELNTILEQALSLPEFALAQMIEQHGLTLDGKSMILEELRPLVAAAASPLQRSLFLAHFSEKLGIAVGELDVNLERAPALSAEPSTVTVKRSQAEPVLPLSMAQRQLVEFMILHPRFYSRLAEAGLRECLVGGLGEALFLQLGSLLVANQAVEPEELLTALPEGAERNLVSELLLRAPIGPAEDDDAIVDEVLSGFIEFLHKFQLKQSAAELMQRIHQAETSGDHLLLQELMVERNEITKKIHN
jgi:DNA primase